MALADAFSVGSPEALGDLVRRCRKAQGMTQAELAGASGLGLRFVGDVERGKATCEVGKVLHLLAMLGLRLEAHGAELGP